jgi:hypothetical protein
MTGQVKEDIISRFIELGVTVAAGSITFAPRLLRSKEFNPEATRFTWFAHTGTWEEIDVPARSLAFTYCGVPVVYTRVDGESGAGELRTDDGTVEQLAWNGGVTLSRDRSSQMFSRSVHLKQISIKIPAEFMK